LFCIDPLFVEYANKYLGELHIKHLADPITQTRILRDESLILKQRLGIDRSRKTFLLFGSLDERKGIFQFLRAIAQIEEDLCRQVCILFVGKISLDANHRIEHILKTSKNYQLIQIVRRFEFIPENDLSKYFHISDVILALYQRHVGMSGILLHAAAAGKPVLSTNYGLMGELVRSHKLGLTVDSTSEDAISQAISRLLREPIEEMCDLGEMEKFVENNSAEKFANTIFSHA
jgi:glycosyltransferase involved in cell wall biosynthesis